MSTKIDELKLDIDELNTLLKQASRQKSKDLISIEIRRLQTELSALSENNITSKTKVALPQETGPKVYEVKLTNYGWDQTEKFVKIYVTLKNVQSLPKESVSCQFTKRSMDLRVLGLDNRNYHLPIINLCEEIDTEKSYIKIKTDLIVVFLTKKSSIEWSHVTGVEKKIKESKAFPVPDEEEMSDPGSSLMTMMKKMYQDGDDEMKKTIAKAWCNSQDKKATSANLGFPDI